MIRLSMTKKQFVYWLGTLTTIPVLLFTMGGLFSVTIYSHVPQPLITSPLSDATITYNAAVEQPPISIVTPTEVTHGLPERLISTNTELATIDFSAIEADSSIGTQARINTPVVFGGKGQTETKAQDSGKTDVYAVQIGSFSEEKNAQAIAQTLKASGYSVATFVVHDPDTRKNQYKVRVGYYLSRDEADIAAKRYREEARSPAFVISPSPLQTVKKPV